MENLLQEAFKRLSLLEDDFNYSELDSGKIDELKSFVPDDVEVPEVEEIDVIDTEAQDESELEDIYEGKVILECECCHSRIYKNKEDVVITNGVANEEDVCPVCGNALGFSVIGKIEAFDPDKDIEAEAEKIEDGDEEIELEEPEEIEDEIEDIPADDVEDEEEKDESLKSSNVASEDSKKLDESLQNSDKASEDSKKLDEAELPLEDRIARKHFDSLLGDEYDEGLDEVLDADEKARMAEITKDGIVRSRDRNEYNELRQKERLPEEICEDDICPECGKNPCTCTEESLSESDEKVEVGCDDCGYETTMTRIEYEDNGGRCPNCGGHHGNFNIWEESVEEAIHPDLAGKKPVKGDKPFTSKADPAAVKKVFEIIDSMSDDEFDLLVDSGSKAYMDDDKEAKAVVKKLFRKYKLPMWALKAFEENWDEGGEPTDEPVDESCGLDESLKNSDKASEDSKKLDEDNEPWSDIEDNLPTDDIEVVDLDDEEGDAEVVDPDELPEENESLNEDINIESPVDVQVEENGKVTIEPKNEESLEGPDPEPFDEPDPENTDGGEIVPLDSEEQADIEANEPEDEEDEEELEDDEFSDFDEDEFDNMGESFIRRVYENVNSFKTTSVKSTGKEFIIEGVINFKSGNSKKTQFVFDNKNVLKSGKLVFEGYNKTFSNNKNTFTLKGIVNENIYKPLVFKYDYSTKQINESNESEVVRIQGRVSAR